MSAMEWLVVGVSVSVGALWLGTICWNLRALGMDIDWLKVGWTTILIIMLTILWNVIVLSLA